MVAELLDAEPRRTAVPPTEFLVKPESQDMIDHGGKDQGFEMEVVAFVGEGALDLAGLFEGAELDLDAPAQRRFR